MSVALEYHPAADVFPLIEGPEFEELVRDVKANGQRVPIVLHDGKILDGRNRYRACQVLEIKPDMTMLPDGTDPVAFVVSTNIRRRHLNPSQVAMFAAELANLQRGGDPQTRKANSSRELLVSQADAARICGTSPASVRRAKRVLQEGTQEDVQAIKKGELTVGAAEKKLRKQAEKPAGQEDRDQICVKTGKGVILANEALNSLTRIPKSDPLRERGFEIVTDWIRTNMGAVGSKSPDAAKKLRICEEKLQRQRKISRARATEIETLKAEIKRLKVYLQMLQKQGAVA